MSLGNGGVIDRVVLPNQVEGMFQAIFMANPDAMAVTRMADQKIIDVNPGFIALIGYSREEALGLTSADLGAWANHEDRVAFWSRLQKHGKVKDFEFALRTRSGELRDVLLSGAIALIAGHAHLVSIFRDITERKRAEDALDKRLRFEPLLADLSSRFTNLPSERVDHEIESGLKEIRDFLAVDRAGLIEISTDRREARLTHVSLDESLSLPFAMDTNVAPNFPWLYEQLVVKGNVFSAPSLDAFPPEGAVDRDSHRQIGIQSLITIPLSVGGAISHLITVNCRQPQSWPEEYIPRLRVLGEVFVNALARQRADEGHKQAFLEIQELKDRLQVEARFLRSEIDISQGPGEIIGKSPAIQQVLWQIAQVAPTDAHVLVTGETGTGKELVARAIHAASGRKDRLMVTVNCATLPPTLIECELFGREKGAYTGALARQIGRFEMADGGTIFLDEIGELSLELQSKLLRVLQEGEFERLGGPTKTIRVNVRVIAATNKRLVEAVSKGDYRKDLYYRLSVFPLHVPPLRERAEDIPLLVWAFVDEFGSRMGKKIDSISQRTMESLKSHTWLGNVRELRNTIERAMILSRGGVLEVQLAEDPEPGISAHLTLEEVERRHILDTLHKTNWRIKGSQGAAVLLGINPSTLTSRMQKLGIARAR